jgi:hypothetical protein
VLAGGVEDLRTVQRQQRLVGRHHVLARRQQAQHRLAGELHPADQLGGHLHLRVAQHHLQVGRQQLGRQTHGTHLGRVAHDDAAQHERPAGAGGQALRVLQQQPGHAAAHRAAADQGDAEGFRHERTRRPREEGRTAPLLAFYGAGAQ